MKEDKNGFLYPVVDLESCIQCGLCERVCPCINQNTSQKPLKIYAAINRDEEIRTKSSSGGIFSMLAEKIIEQGGIVFGACFDEKWEVIHDYTETKDGINKFRGSKYVQSRIGDAYVKVKSFLTNNRLVLFSRIQLASANLQHLFVKALIRS